MPIHSGHTLQRSREPPARQRFTASEVRSIMSGSNPEPADPVDEDIKVLALFDNLMEEDGLSDDSEDNLSYSSELFFPFWRRPTLFSLNSDSDSDLSLSSGRFSDELDFYDSFEEEMESDSDGFDGWDSVAEEAEEEGESSGRVNVDNRNWRYIDQVLRRAASEGMFGMEEDNLNESGNSMERSVRNGGDDFDVYDSGSVDHPTVCPGEGSSGENLVAAGTAGLHDLEQKSQEEQVAKGKDPASATNLTAQKSKNKGKGLSSHGSDGFSGSSGTSSREELKTSSGMKLRSREIQVPISHGYNRKRKTPSRAKTSSDAAATSNSGEGACALDSAPTLPVFDPHGADLPGTSSCGRDTLSTSPGPSDNSHNAGINGRTRSKRKKLLDSRARCDNGFQDKYVAEEFLKTKSPTNFYSSNDNSRGKEGSRGRKKKGGPGPGGGSSSS